MARKRNTQNTFKDLLGDVGDSYKRAFDDLLDRDDDKGDDDWFSQAARLQALANPAGLLSAMGGPGGGNPLTALGGAGNPLAALGGANPLAALGGGAGGGNPLAALGGANPANALSGMAGATQAMAALPQQITQLSELIGSLLTTLQGVQQGAESLTSGLGGLAGGLTQATGTQK
ncbi:hypothetical protein RM572_17515 [Streptomyces sp. DSM 42041]|uniref:Type VII secretion system-associated protein n=1 Tax=Streptomyces hazeniae TaxID=3075538 RepID=A0ABU2NUX6_9ACTN|nr:hypothetical protein [Streptomyces sp. DSM 42041]MDT0380554.1 hypothetical protein [Streptomyces sp. DSM 42041]